MNVNESYSNLNFGTKPTTAAMETIDVTIDPTLILNDYAKAFVLELERRNPVRAQTIGITEAEMQEYLEGLVAIRVECVHGVCKHWREIKQLLIPAWIEFTLSQIGEVLDTDRGLRINPKFEHDYDLNAMLSTSDKLRMFMADGVVLLKDAFPRSNDGDPETMAMAIIGDYIHGQSKDAHSIASYVAAFLGFKLQEEASFKMLYRVRYDDVQFIRTMLLREGSLF